MVQMIQSIENAPLIESHLRRQRGRKVMKYMDTVLVSLAHEKAQKHQLEAEIEIKRLPKRRRVPRHPDEVYITQAQIMAQMEAEDSDRAEDPAPDVAPSTPVEEEMIQVIEEDEGSL
jgi:predicted secreted protein